MTTSHFFPALQTMAQNLAIEDSRATADPIYVVQQKVRQFPGDENSDPHYWVDGDWEEVDEVCAKSLDEYEEDFNSDATKGYTKVYYRDVYQFVQPFFTEQGANEYIRINGHNLREPRIYVDSAYRNAEWQAIREFLRSYSASNSSL